MEEYIRLTAQGSAPRLDKYLAEVLLLSRTRVADAIKSGGVTVNGASAKPGDKLKAGNEIIVRLPEPQPTQLAPEDIPLDIVYEDSDIAVVNKPQGMVAHPAPGHASGTLAGALLHALDNLSGIGGQMRPGIVHRLDKDTSGLLVVAKNDAAHASLSAQLAEKSARRVYFAIVHGNIKEDAVDIDKPVGRSRGDRKKMAVDARGRHAVTHVTVLERFGDFTFVQAALETGRTHQIRVHLASISHPVAGDPVYGPRPARLHKGGQLLHAGQLSFIHPSTGQRMTFDAPLPEYFETALQKLRKET